MNYISAELINDVITPLPLVDKLQSAFASDITTPQRQHFDIPNPELSRETTLLVMPSWEVGADIGVKLVTVVPESFQFNLPSIQGSYVLMDAVKGGVKAMLDAPTLTAKRTAAASALASRFMSKTDSKVLLMVGTGTLAPELIQAHCAVRPIEKILIWGRNSDKAVQVKNKLSFLQQSIDVVDDLADAVKKADIISCATMSLTPLIEGAWLLSGQHLDMVGAYRPDMREADDECITRSRIVVDNFSTAIIETGDLKIPLETGVITKTDIEADLFALCRGEYEFVRDEQDITLFKSVGHALEDLAAAQLVIEKINEG